MTIMEWIGLALCAALAIYLFVALLVPEEVRVTGQGLLQGSLRRERVERAYVQLLERKLGSPVYRLMPTGGRRPQERE